MSNVKYLNIDKNRKTIKGQKRGYMTGILYLAPSMESGINVCPFASAGCAAACLYTSGHGRYQRTKDSRIKKTRALFENKTAFIAQLEIDIEAGIRKAKREKMTFTVRINGTSDLAVETWGLMEKFPKIQFYDYTKNPFRMTKYLKGEMPKNYHLTFSLSESNKEQALAVLAAGGNVAAVFATREPKEFPKTYFGHKVVDGDRDDLRFKDKKNVVVALKMKGRAMWDKAGFVQPLVENETLDLKLAA